MGKEFLGDTSLAKLVWKMGREFLGDTSLAKLAWKMGKEFLGADHSLTRCCAARCERGWEGLTRIFSFASYAIWMGRRHIGAMRLVASRMVPDTGRPQVMSSFLRENEVTGARLLRSPVSPILP